MGLLGVFVSGLTVSALAQAPPAQPPPQGAAAVPAGQVRSLSMEDAVKLALENNLGVQVERLNPDIDDVSVTQAQSAWAPNLTSTVGNRSQTSPISGFFAGATDKLTRQNFQADVGANGLLPWGANYTAIWGSTRANSNSVYDSPNPALGSNLTFSFTQPRSRTSASIRRARSSSSAGAIARSPTSTCAASSCRLFATSRARTGT